MKIQTLELPAYIRALTVMIFIIVLVFFLIVGKSLLVPLFMGGFFAILLTPLSMWLESKKVPRTLSSIISLLVMIALVGGILTFVIGNVASFTQDFDDVSGRLTDYAEDIDQWSINTFSVDPELSEKANTDYLKNVLTRNSSSIGDFALNAVGSLTGLVLIPVFMFFFLLYRNHLTHVIIQIYKDKDPELVKMRIVSLRKVILNYIVGVVKVMGILAILNITAFSLLGIKHAVFFGTLGAMLNIIPYVGPFFGAMLPMIYSFLTKDSLFYPAGVLVSYQIIQMIEGNFLTPKIVGGNVNLNAFITFLGLIVGGTIWGVAGMILIIPMMAILREIFDLSESTRPYALLLGEEKEEEKIEAHEDEVEEIENEKKH
ncbi:putative PurR-regulated permease PerM [Algoriphagus ratkowskyi]|uniref:AI-2E family transporter n=1 Tax=Algoriphagus ratkowskyi TaxID=57028 RepID=A0A2W7RK79_9BACT|nr:AI-2E family transporter [Algoriphagus ratkowskyi]PZX61233.1 putative PurR-regulated permease PerM [Algoriphagus ratkowskyi]TXD79350.1 AI-2E family transporter [Algoriphagus ratkowskyi]